MPNISSMASLCRLNVERANSDPSLRELRSHFSWISENVILLALWMVSTSQMYSLNLKAVFILVRLSLAVFAIRAANVTD